jgi:hypothetical protein
MDISLIKTEEVINMLYVIVGSIILGLLVAGTFLCDKLVTKIIRFMKEEEA